jgi:choice-of-anchor B domain-containing protein
MTASPHRFAIAIFTTVVAGSALCGSAAAQFPAENVSLYHHYTAAELGSSFAEDCWGYVSGSGREYAIVGLSQGTGFIEITDPANPVVVAIKTQPNRGRDMKVYQNYVYSSSDSGPTHVYDVSDIDNGVITLVRSISRGTHNLAVDEVSGFLYLAAGGPMHAYDLSDPANPTFAGTWPGQTHDVQVVTYTSGPYAGRQIAFVFAGWDQWLDIVDVTNKSNMVQMGRTSYPSPGYTHHGWLTADRHYLYIADELDEINGQPLTRTFIIDVSDLANPTYVRDFTTGQPSTDHNLYVYNGFIFEANYTSGMHIFDASDPLNPVEVGYFDTYPAHNNPTYDVGAWTAYPFFPSGTVIVTDRTGGLFILDVSAAVGGNCPADLNNDGLIDLADLGILLADFGCVAPGPCPGDIDGDGDTDLADLGILLSEFGNACP